MRRKDYENALMIEQIKKQDDLMENKEEEDET